MDDFAVQLDERFAAGWFYLTCDGANIDDVVGSHEAAPVVATDGGLECFAVEGANLQIAKTLRGDEELTDAGSFELDCRAAFIASSTEEPIFRLFLEAPGSGRVFTNQASKEDRPSRVLIVLPKLVRVEETMRRSWFRRALG